MQVRAANVQAGRYSRSFFVLTRFDAMARCWLAILGISYHHPASGCPAMLSLSLMAFCLSSTSASLGFVTWDPMSPPNSQPRACLRSQPRRRSSSHGGLFDGASLSHFASLIPFVLAPPKHRLPQPLKEHPEEANPKANCDRSKSRLAPATRAGIEQPTLTCNLLNGMRTQLLAYGEARPWSRYGECAMQLP